MSATLPPGDNRIVLTRRRLKEKSCLLVGLIGAIQTARRGSHSNLAAVRFAPPFIPACSRPSRKPALLAASDALYADVPGDVVRRRDCRTGGAITT